MSESVQPTSKLLRAALRVREANMAIVLLCAIAIAIVMGGLLIIFTTPMLTSSWGGFFSHPGGTITLTLRTVWYAYEMIFQGAIIDFHATNVLLHHWSTENFAAFITPLAGTLSYATPLIVAGLGLAIGFRSGLFDIGGRGQIIGGGMAAAWVGFTFNFTPVLEISLEIIAAIIVGGLLGGFAGVLKAYTGAHEVIVTMMTNYIVVLVMGYLLIQPLFAQPGVLNGLSKTVNPSAQLPEFLSHISSTLYFNFGFVFALIAVVATQWFFDRSKTGFELLAVGRNAEAARTAGINVRRSTILTLALAGGVLGLSGMMQVAGVDHHISPTFGGSYGFDAITVALLGRNRPWGVFFGAIFFGAMATGGHIMQAVTPTNIDYSLAQVIQAVVVFCVATPALIIEMFKLREPARRAAPSAQGAAA